MKKQLTLWGLALGLAVSPLAAGQASAEAPVNVLSTKKMNSLTGTPSFVSGKLSEASSKSAKEVVFNYLQKESKTFKLGTQKAEDSFTVKSVTKDELGRQLVRIQQTYKIVSLFRIFTCLGHGVTLFNCVNRPCRHVDTEFFIQ